MTAPFRWPNDPPPTPEALRAALTQHDRIIEALQQDLVVAERADAEYREERVRLEGALAAARAGHTVSVTFDGRTTLAASQTAPRSVLRAVERAFENVRIHDSQRQRWLQATPTTPLDLSAGVTRECAPDPIRARIARTQTARGQIEHDLAGALERQLSDREQAERQVASMPEAASVKSELAKLRARLGI